MSILSPAFRLATKSNAVMESAMNTCRLAARMPRWLVAAGVALAALGATHAYAQTEGAVPSDIPELEIMPKKPAEGPAIVESRVEPFFHKVGAQMSCDFVRYRIRFGFRFDQAVLDSPGFADQITRLQFTLRDELPPGLAIETVSIAGDITGSGGGALPAHVVSTTSSPDDTVTFGSFQLSPADLDGFGAPGERSMSMTITARIDQAAFPAPTVVANQATLDVSRAGGAVTTIASHDPALPDDGDIATGEPTKITIDLTGCDRPPPPPPPGDGPQEACFKVETGEVDCTPGGGAFIYHMDVGPEMAGNVVQLKTTNPGVTIWPASQIVPPAAERCPGRSPALRPETSCIWSWSAWKLMRVRPRASASAARRPWTSSSPRTSTVRMTSASPTSRSRSAPT